MKIKAKIYSLKTLLEKSISGENDLEFDRTDYLFYIDEMGEHCDNEIYLLWYEDRGSYFDAKTNKVYSISIEWIKSFEIIGE